MVEMAFKSKSVAKSLDTNKAEHQEKTLFYVFC